MAFVCTICDKLFARNDSLARHQKTCSPPPPTPSSINYFNAYYALHPTLQTDVFNRHITTIHSTLPDRLTCSTCSIQFADPEQLQHHEQLHTTPKHFHCSSCTRSFIRLDSLRLHQKSCESRRKRPAPTPTQPAKRQCKLRGGGFVPIRSALKKNAAVHRMDYGQERDIFEQLRSSILDDGFTFIQKQSNIKYFFTLKLTFQKAVDPTVITNPPIYFRSEPFIQIPGENVHADLQLAHSQLLHQLDTFERNGSGKLLFL